jgi:spore germination protein YaaH
VAAKENWDSVSQSAGKTYTEDGLQHVARFETQGSIRLKTDLVKKYHLAGKSIGSLGREVLDGLLYIISISLNLLFLI